MDSPFSELLSHKVIRSAALQGFQIYVLGNDLQLLDSVHHLETSQSELALAISLRGPAGAWPLPRSLVEKALQLSADVDDIYLSRLVPKDGDVYNESLMLLSLLLKRGHEYSRVYNRRCRFLWLEGPMEIVIEPSKDLWTMELSADRLLQLGRRLTSDAGASCPEPSLRYYKMHEAQLTLKEAEWLPTGPAALQQIALDLGGEHSPCIDASLRFAVEGENGLE